MKFKKVTVKNGSGKQGLFLAVVLPIVLVSGLSLAVLGSLLDYAYLTTASQQQTEQLADRFGQAQASLISHYLQDRQQQLELLAATEQARQQFLDGDKTSQTEHAKAWLPHYAYGEQLRLIPFGSARVDQEEDVPLRFADLALIRAAERTGQLQYEAFTRDKQRFISWVAPVASADDNKVLGCLLLVTHLDQLKQQLSALPADMGNTKILQTIDSKELSALSLGMGAHADAVSNVIANSDWRVEYTYSEQLKQLLSQEPDQLWIHIALTAATISAMILFLFWYCMRVVQRESVELASYINALSKGKSTSAPDLRLGPMLRLAGAIGEMLDTYQAPQASAANAVTPTSASTIQDDPELDFSATGLETEEEISASLFQDGVLDVEEVSESEAQLLTADNADLDASIFRAYDIRGIVEQQLTTDTAYLIGVASGSEALAQQQGTVVVGMDGRHSSAELKTALCKGLMESGCNVIDIGTVPTPLLYFATETLDTQTGVMVTASHNPAEYNGFKFVMAGQPLAAEGIQDLYQRIVKHKLHQAVRPGELSEHDIQSDYINFICNDVALASGLKVVVDAGNGVAGPAAIALLEELGCDVVPLYCDIDGDFPNHHPDPTIADNLIDLTNKVAETQADLGVAFDGDGDRLGVVTPERKTIAADRLLMLFAKDIVSRNPGADVLFDVKCTRRLNALISSYGGRPVMWKSGHSNMKLKMRETGALLAGEYSGHIFFKERWFGFDDGLYTACRLLEILSIRDQDIDSVFASFPEMHSTPEMKIPIDDRRKFDLIEKLASAGDFMNGKVTQIDGLRVDFPRGWGLIRASNTTPAITLRFEADDEEELGLITDLFKQELSKVDADAGALFP